MLSRTRRFISALAAISALLAASLSNAPRAAAAPTAAPAIFFVNSTNDVPAEIGLDDIFSNVCRTASNNTVCTLRAAIMKANRHLGGATIHVPAGTYPLTIARANGDGDESGSLDISNTVTLIGAGPGATIIDGSALDAVFVIFPNTTAILSGLTIRNGDATSSAAPVLTLTGGGIYNRGSLNLVDSALRGNTARNGGGALFNALHGSANLTRVTVDGNTTLGEGGGLANYGALTVTASTVSGNSSNSYGGGVFNAGSALAVFNSTLSNNRSRYDGGGLDNQGPATVLATTIAGNLADSLGAGGQRGGGVGNNGVLHLANTLLADNYISSTLNECGGFVDSQDYNLIQTTDGCAITLTTHDNSDLTDVFLGELADNGGPTLTRALLAGSPALDVIPATLNGPCRDPFGAAPVPDQRGVARPVKSLCDIGAYEGELPLPIFGRNLIRNGDAEAGAGTATTAWVGAPNWFTNGPFTVVTYNAPGGFPSVPTDTVPANHGTNCFAGGLAASATGTERFDVSAAARLIDTGQASFVLSGDLGGFGADLDNAQLSVAFDNALDQPTGAGRVIGPVTAADRASLSGSHTGFLHRFAAGSVPTGTRVIFITLAFSRFSGVGTYDDGYADNLSLVLKPPPVFLPFLVR